MEAAKLVNGAILGFDFRTIVINSKSYMVKPPTIAKIAGAGYYLSDFGEVKEVGDIFKHLANIEDAAKALSWLIQGDEELTGELSKGTLEEVTRGIEAAYSLISAEGFTKLSILARNVARLTANPRP